MKPSIPKYPLRVLVVEDHERERQECVDRLMRKYPSAQVEEAGTRDEARTLILEAYAKNRPYDIAVLDLKLPDATGGIESRDTSLASLIIDTFGPEPTRLIQWTAFPEDEAVSAFIADKKIPQSGIVYEVISKRDVEWPRKMEKFINRFIAEKTVGRLLDDPYFKRMRDRSVVFISRRPEVARAPVDIPAYMQALIDVWPLLEPHRRLEALATFKGSEWELEGSEDGVKLINPQTAQAIEDARENARIVAEVMGSDTHQA